MVAFGTFIGLAALALGASALVLDPMNYVGRSLHGASHRRQALKPRSPAPTKTMAERRYLRQKRCQSQQSSFAPPAVTSSAQNVTDNVPQNVAPAPTPTTTTPDADQQPASTPTPNNGGNDNNSGSSSSPPPSGGGDTYSGDLTFYEVGLGACGVTNVDSDMICAASMLLYDGFDGYSGPNPNDNPICGKQVSVTYGGVTITLTVEDRCVGCAKYDLDLSPAAFSLLAPESQGRLHNATWQFL